MEVFFGGEGVYFNYFFLSRAIALGQVDGCIRLGSAVTSHMILSKIFSFSEPWFP